LTAILEVRYDTEDIYEASKCEAVSSKLKGSHNSLLEIFLILFHPNAARNDITKETTRYNAETAQPRLKAVQKYLQLDRISCPLYQTDVVGGSGPIDCPL